MSRRPPYGYSQSDYGPGPGAGQYPMQGPGYQGMQYGSGGYGSDMYDGSGPSYPTPVCSILQC